MEPWFNGVFVLIDGLITAHCRAREIQFLFVPNFTVPGGWPLKSKWAGTPDAEYLN